MSLYAVGVDLGTMQNSGAVPTRVSKSVTYVAGTTGATGQHALFTVTGLVLFRFHGRNTSNLTSGGAATLSQGHADSVDAIIGAAAYTNITGGAYLTSDNEWVATTAAYGGTRDWNVANGQDITENIADAAITGGANEYVVEYIPLSAGASIVAA